MKRSLLLVCSCLLVGFMNLPANELKYEQVVYPGRHWKKGNPEKHGWSVNKLNEAMTYAETLGQGGLIVIENGVSIVDWGNTSKRSKIASVRKSLISALFGIHAHDIDLSKTLEQSGIDDTPPILTNSEKRATILMLLKSRSGIYHNSVGNTPAMLATRPVPGSHEPDTFWYYNNWDFNALGTIFEKELNTKIPDEFYEKIAKPLQMEDFRVKDFYYSSGDESIHQAYHFRMSARDLARFGYLYLRQGKWQTQQVIPSDWVVESTKSYSNAGDNGGYGYLWWIADHGKHLPGVSLKDGSYSARGAGGKYIIVIPDRDLVVVYCTDVDYPDHATKIAPEAIPKGINNAQMGQLLNLILEAKPANMASGIK